MDAATWFGEHTIDPRGVKGGMEPEDMPTSTDKKCPACGSTDVHEVPANTRTPQAAHLWSCAKCRNTFRLVEAAGDQRDPHFDC